MNLALLREQAEQLISADINTNGIALNKKFLVLHQSEIFEVIVSWDSDSNNAKYNVERPKRILSSGNVVKRIPIKKSLPLDLGTNQ